VTDPVASSAEPSWQRARRQLVFALDYPTLAEAREGAAVVRDAVGVVKVGLELFVRAGPAAVSSCRELGLEVFLDLKLHDIPATVARAVRSAGALGVRYLTVHAAGGATMLQQAAASAAEHDLELVAITVLTSLDDGDLRALGMPAMVAEQARRLAELGWRAGLRAFVCSAAEASSLRALLGAEARIITPGIRPGGAPAGDQKRLATPSQAIAAGADMLVVGRPIRDAADPAAAARALVDEIAGAKVGPSD